MRSIVRLLLLCVFALVWASGVPVGAAAPFGWVRPDGRPVAWNNSQPISYSVDQGPLGRISNSDAVALVQTAFQRWQQVDTASISFTPAAPLSQDITGANVLGFLNNLPAGVNPIIFDTDGSVMRALLGSSTAAIALGRPLTVDPATGAITSGMVVINGLYIDGRFNPDDLSLPNTGGTDFNGVVVQEIGRFLGLGYSQLNTDLILNGTAGDNALIPQMYPQAVAQNGDQLTVDDRASLAALYPLSSPTTTGTIHGQVRLPDGTTGLQGINVIARRAGDPTITTVSAISGMQFKNEIGPPGLDGSRQIILRGDYRLTGLPPGSYTISIEALRSDSLAGPLRQPAFLPGGTQYYTPGGSTTDPNAAVQVPVGAGQVVENVNLTVAGPAGQPVQAINEQEPNEFPEQAQTLPLAAHVRGSIQPTDANGVTVPLPSGATAPAQDLYRLNLTQPTIVTATLSADNPGADLSLYLLSGPVATAPNVVAISADPGTPPETFQLRLSAGIYFLAVGESTAPGTSYTLDVSGTPAPDPTTPPPPHPRLNNLIAANVTSAGANVSFISDLPSNTILYVTNPLTEFSNPAATATHNQPLSNLAPGTAFRLRTLAVTPALGVGSLPDIFFSTALPALPNGVGQIQAGVADTIDDPTDPNAVYVVLSFRNVGTGDSTGVTINTLTAPTGWAFTNPLPLPLGLGYVGRGGSGILMTRLQKTAGTASVSRRAHIASSQAPIISGSGTYSSPGVGQQTFTFGNLTPPLVLTKTATPASPRPGDVVTFTLTATNQATTPAAGLTISDTLTGGLTFAGASAGGQNVGGTVTWNIGALAPGASASVTLQAQVPANAIGGTTLTNVALLSGGGNPSPVASNVLPLNIAAPPPTPPQLQITKTADRAQARPGETITYTISYQNAGPTAATSVMVTDVLPAGTSLASAPGGVGAPAGNPIQVTWNVGSLGVGQSGSQTLQLVVSPGTPGGTTITNTAQISAAEAPTPVASAPAIVQVTAPPQLLVTKSADRTSAQPNDLITYTITVSNAGSGPATNVQLVDAIPPGTAYFDSGNGSQTGGTLTWNLGTLGPTGSMTVNFRVQVLPAAVGLGVVNNSAQVTSTEIPNPVISNLVAVTVTSPPPPPPQLQVAKAANQSTVQVGQSIRYSITVSNVGGGPATNVQIYDAVPANTSFQSADTNGGLINATTIGWTLSQLTAGTSATVSFQVLVTGSNGPITNVAQARAAEAPTLVSSNGGNPVIVQVLSQPQLQIQKAVLGATTVGPNGLITYQLSYSNAIGGGTATGVTIQDTLPLNTSFAGASNGGSAFGTTMVWNIGSLAPGQAGSVTLQVRVNPGVPGGTVISNTATIRSNEVTNPIPSNAAIATVSVPPPSLTLVKQVDVTSAQPGGPVNFLLTVTNNGAGSATSVTITDTIPAGLNGIAALDGGFLSFGTATWNVGTLTPGATRQVRLQTQVSSNAAGTITNVAQVRSAEIPSPVISNPASVTVTQPPPPINLTIQKVLSPAAPTASPGDTLRYVISFQNNGQGTVSGAAIVDQVPANVQVVATSQGAVLLNGVLTWNLPLIAPGQGGSVAFQAVVNANTPSQTLITNQAQITVASQGYIQQSNAVSTVVNVPPPSLSLTKQVDKTTALAGDNLTYTLNYANTSNQTANQAVILDQLPAGVSFGSSPNGPQLVNGSPPNSGLFVRFSLGDLPPGASGSVQFTVQINNNVAAGTPITNQGAINALNLPQPAVSNPVTTTVASAPPPPINLSIQKVLNPAAPTAAPGDTLYYVIAFQNNGQGTVTGAAIVDQIPANTQFKVASQGNTPVNGVLTWNLPAVAPGQGGSVAFQVVVNANTPNQTVITNQAQITVASQGYIQQSNVVSTVVTVASPTLTLTKQVDKNSAAPGDPLTYTLNYANTSNQTANQAVILDQLPAGVSFGSSPNSPQLVNGSPPNSGLFVRFSLGNLSPGASGSVQFTVQINNNVASGTPITNQGAINAQGLAQPVVSNPVTTTVSAAPPPPINLTIQKVLNPAAPTAAPGDTLYYVIAFQNNGTGTVNGAAVVDTIPANTQFKTASQGVQPVSGVLTWNLPAIAPGQGGSVAFQAVVNPGTPNQTAITNQAQITVTSQGYAQLSNVVTTIVTVSQPASLTLTKQVDKSVAGVGDTLTYTLNYANTGSQTAHQVVISDSLTGGLIFIPGNNGAQVNGQTVSFALGDVGPGGSGSISFQAQIGNSLPVGTVVPNQARLISPDLPQPVTSNQVSTTVGPSSASFAGTWFAISNGPSVSLTADPQNGFTVWAVSQDRQTIIRGAQGRLNPDGTFDVFSADQLVHFTGQIAADRQSAKVTAARNGFVPFTVTAPRALDVVPSPLPNPFIGTFNGTATANDGAQIQVLISIDPGGNSTFQASVIPPGSTSVRSQFAHFYVTPSGQLIDPNGNRQVGTLQVQNNTLVVNYDFQSAIPPAYENNFSVPLQPLP
jgi:uncharacterized repeat protein (TIGR01451 family)